MNKKIFVLLVTLMSLSLMGIIFVQLYWIRSSFNDKEDQFSNAVEDVLAEVAERVENRELRDYFDHLAQLIDSVGSPKRTHLRNIFFVNEDARPNEVLFYSHGILEEEYDISSTFFDNGSLEDTTTTIKNFTSTRTTIFKEDYVLDGDQYKLTPSQRLEKIGGLSKLEKAQYEDVFMEEAKTRPVHKRVSKQEIELLLNRGLKNRGIAIDYEYAIIRKDIPTKVKSRKFEYDKGDMYAAPIFRDSENKSDFWLSLSFPKKKKFLFNRVMSMAMLSLIFTLVIILAFSYAIYQLIKQKQISEIKSDFINNMTHEFKTPIATINLAIDAIKNPKSMGDNEKLKRYLGMIKEENNRMHAQVENVLRISKLEKNQLEINKDRNDVHELVNDAVSHVELIVSDRGGYVKTHLDAKRSEILANETHFTNVLVNILDNAVKYSPEAPKIDVFTETTANSILIKIQDQGAGMSKAVAKRVFEKFYREHTGNIHNVKGHGLGLAYVKKIVDDHQGEVYVESEKGKGSTFYVKLPLI